MKIVVCPRLEPLVTVERAAEVLQCSKWTIYKRIERGKLSAFPQNGRLWLKRADIQSLYARDVQRCRPSELRDATPREEQIFKRQREEHALEERLKALEQRDARITVLEQRALARRLGFHPLQGVS